MNYKEKYEKALGRARKLHSEPTGGTERIVCEQIFPELMESTDERMRKELLDYLKERQIIEGLTDTKVKMDWVTWLEKQGEQKPIDKVEPKFKVGDWIASARGTARIIGIGANDSDFLLEYTDGDQESLSIEYVNSTYTKWTIQRAWDGDVLISACNHPFIYNGNSNPSYVGAYGGIVTASVFKLSVEKCHWTENINIHPATKEQQDYLFKKMKEAGYEWEGHTKKLICK